MNEITITIHLRTPGFEYNMTQEEIVREADLPQLAAFWESSSCPNVRSWERKED